MKILKTLAILVSLFPAALLAQTGAVSSYCNRGGTQASTSNMKSSNYQQGIIPGCTVTVYLTGTTTLATIYSNSTSTPLSNPFTANVSSSPNSGAWIFWAAVNQGLDVVMSGGIAPNTYPQPVTLTDVFPSQSFNPASGLASATAIQPIEVNGAQGPVTSGNVEVSCPNCSNLQMQQVPPMDGQYVIVYPTAFTDGTTGQGVVSATATGGSVASGFLLAGGTGSATITWSSPALPSYVSPGNVTAVYAFAISTSSTVDPPSAPSGACGGSGIPWSINSNFLIQITATASGLGTFALVPGSGGVPYQLQQVTAQMTSATGANFHTSTISATFDTSGNCFGGAGTNIPLVGYFVYYTGTAPPASNAINVEPPLFLQDDNLGIDGSAQFPGLALVPTTVGLLPPAKYETGWLESVTDGTSSTDCSTGGGSTLVLCKSDGTAWSAYSSGGGSLSLTTTGTSGPATLSGSTLNVPQYQAALTLTTTGSSGPATLSGGALNIPQYSSGGGGGGGTQVPANALVAGTGTSIWDDDGGLLAPNIAVSSWSCNGTICTVNTSAAHNGANGQWWNLRHVTGWFSPPSPFVLGTGFTLFQITVTGSTQFTFPYTLNAGSGSGGYVETALNNLPFVLASQGGMPGLNNVYMALPTTPSIVNEAAHYTALFHSVSPAVTGNPGYLVIGDFGNDLSLCSNASAIEAAYQSLWASAHTDGWVVVTTSNVANNLSQSSVGCGTPAFATMYAVDTWLLTQKKTTLNAASGQYTDIYVPLHAIYNDPYTSTLQGSAAGGWGMAANAIALSMVTGNGQQPPAEPEYFGGIPGNFNAASNGYVHVARGATDAGFSWLDTSLVPDFWINTFDDAVNSGNILCVGAYVGSKDSRHCQTGSGFETEGGNVWLAPGGTPCASGTYIKADGTGCNTPSGGGSLTPKPPYWFDGTNFFMPDGFQATRPPASPTFINSLAPANVVTGTNGNLILQATSADANDYFLEESGSSSVEAYLQQASYTQSTGISPAVTHGAFGLWAWDSTNNVIWGIYSSPIQGSNGPNVCLIEYTYSGSGNPTFVNTSNCQYPIDYGHYGNWAHLRLNSSAGIIQMMVCMDGTNSNCQVLYERSIGTVSELGVIFSPNSSASSSTYASTLDVASLLVQ